jgi:hypothetical protein
VTAPVVATTTPSTSTPPTAPTTVAPPTTSPPTAPATTAFAVDDLTAFISALQAGDERGGQASQQLGDRLEKLVEGARKLAAEGDGRALDKWQRDAEKLLEDVAKWSEKGQLDPSVAAQARARIEELGSSTSG